MSTYKSHISEGLRRKALKSAIALDASAMDAAEGSRGPEGVIALMLRAQMGRGSREQTP